MGDSRIDTNDRYEHAPTCPVVRKCDLHQAGENEKRIRRILPHAEVMIHQPSGGTQGQSSDMVIAAEHIKDRRKVLNDILSANTGKGLSEIEKDTERDFWMNADAAVDYGIVDHVLR